ncbi:type IIG restriction enzyme/methyltransferase [Helicobacter pylori]|uniref:type IIG restriction enzyme/methyltransferase n=1 Tax=Helicobacter pylori TaxID=210 RepID=UPI00271208A2|nr:Eco57I restriction-modification methylase domain-containing protein [Helicobacter pylori]MDO7815236.1 Eco57I restriction-modification methylase domain-containing protein [Helicobacter pylori]MDO7819770.1 Eco57I restriction-modification methylase domain-containing protein [Helicobacter pylori]MDO7829165.1 Eco57I restriction-modification methylase domain-containing protein [Helicobacter pylori]MDO7866177.1 Eco57I restriction-modification methylase domain-containing protein [Helicobacter pylori
MIRFTRILLKDFIKKYNPPTPTKETIENFEKEINSLLENAPRQDDEEFQKNEINSFLKNTYGYRCNTNKKVDSAIYVDGEVQVLIEVKALNKKTEFPKNRENPFSKAFCQMVLYFLEEREKEKNNSLKHTIICNAHEFFLFDCKDLLFLNDNKRIKKFYKNYAQKEGTDSSKPKFYEDLEQYLKEDFQGELRYTYFNLNDDFKELPLIYQVLSQEVLLKQKKTLDANTLNKDFYEELLYILGLEEQNDKGKILIKPSHTQNSLSDALKKKYKNLDDEEVMALLIAWNNRILFLRLLESLLISFKHFEDKDRFLTIENFKDFNALNTLFFEVLAKKNSERSLSKEDKILEKIPYLNSSLFDKTPLESKGHEIKLLNNKPLEIYPKSVLKKDKDYQEKKDWTLLEYLFEFLRVYDFTTTPKDIKDNQNNSESRLINPSVLGLVFEKLNGYKEGSFYTPSFITSYMCKESITPIVLDKFNATYQWDCENLKALREKIDRNFSNEKAKEYLNTLLTLRICDPAVGSGHFLVSALNEMVLIAYKLGLIASLHRYELKLENDEIIIHYTPTGEIFNYKKPDSENDPHHQIQKELFELKKDIIENCLFGVDINPNSCEITKLRLWIELLKYSYYIFEEGKNTNALETLPNIDINIKCANSLISRFNLNDDLKKIPNIKQKIQEYKDLVAQYKDPNPLYPLNKADLINKIQDLKNTFSLTLKDPKTKAELEKAIEKHITKYNDFALDDKSLLAGLNYFTPNLFGTPKLSPKEEEEAFASYGRIRALRKKLDDALSGGEYHNAFEWRFEFPEVLDDEGDFLGFDCIIGNPPYIKEGGNKELFASTKRLRTYQGKMDIWYHFVGIGLEILKQNGVLSFIATNNWTTNAGAEKLRNILLRETQFILLIDFGDYRVFESADIQTMIMCFKKIISPNQYFFDYRKIIAKKPSDTNRITLLQRKECEGNLYLNAKIEKKNLINKTLFFSHFNSIFNTILKNAILFLNKKEITNGIHPHYDRINKKINEKFSNQFFNGEGIFVLSEAEKNNLKLSQKEMKLLKPSYETAEIMKYLTLSQNQHWIIYTDSSFKNPKSMDDYPNLKKHLDRFKEVITSDNKPYGLHRARDERFFTGNPRIIVLRKCAKEPIFSYVNFDCYVSATFYIIKTKRFDSKFLVGLLNSLLIRFWLKHRGKVQGNNYQIDKEPLMNIPLIKITKSNKPTADKITALVDKILQAKEKDPKANTQRLEKEIDALVYQLYNLTDEEIKTIENGQ